jgi:hypothetical protein
MSGEKSSSLLIYISRVEDLVWQSLEIKISFGIPNYIDLELINFGSFVHKYLKFAYD